MNKNIILTIAIPTFQGAKTIRETLESIIIQITEDIEILIIDNASTDNTKDIVNEFLNKHYHIHYLRNEKNVGLDANYDLAIKNANGEFVWLFSDDDVLLDNSISSVIRLINLIDESYGAILIDCIMYNFKKQKVLIDGVNVNNKQFIVSKEENIYKTAAKDMIGIISTLLIRKDIIKNVDLSILHYSFHIQTGILSYISCVSKILVTNEKLFLFRRDDEPRWTKHSYTLKFYFGFEIAALFGLENKNDIKHLVREKIKQLYIFFLRIRKHEIKNKFEVFIQLFTNELRLYKFYLFWLELPILVCILIIPSFIIRKMNKIYNYFIKVKSRNNE